MGDPCYPRIVAAVLGETWAIQPEKLDAILAFIELKARGEDLPADVRAELAKNNPDVQPFTIQLEAGPAAESTRAGRKPKTKPTSGNIGVIPIRGVIAPRMSMFEEISGGTSLERTGRVFDAMVRDPDIGAIVLHVESPGGAAYGVPEFADKVFAARDEKRIIAVADCYACSAAYWISAAAGEVVVTPSGDVGSVGAIAVHVDQSKFNEDNGFNVTLISAGQFKTEGNPHEPLGDEALDHFQSRVDETHDKFVAALARYRGVSESHVRKQFGRGRLVRAEPSITARMADRVETFGEVIEGLRGARNRKSGSGNNSGASRNKSTKLEAAKLELEAATR